jgi:hypothetical protein
VNYAVTEALGSCELKTICRSMQPNAEGTHILLRHAQDMRADGERLIQTLASSSDIPGSGGPNSGAAAAAAVSEEARKDPRRLTAATPLAPLRNPNVPVEADRGTATSPGTLAAAGIPSEGIVAAQQRALADDLRGSAPYSVTSLIQTTRELIHTIGEVSGD